MPPAPNPRVPHVVGTARRTAHSLHKSTAPSVRLLAGRGVEGDAHSGPTVQHRSRVAVDPTQRNLRQVHLLPSELLDELTARGFDVAPGRLGENITTCGVDLLALPRRTWLRIGPEAVLELTGLRNPCAQLDDYQPGLLDAVLDRTPEGDLIRRAGVMAVVRIGGTVRPGDPIRTHLPPPPRTPLERV